MQNLILIGMMGCGKTTVGALLAQRLGRTLIDTDELIETQEGRSIPAIFSENGEEFFRGLELSVCEKLSLREDLVIACGGGLPLRDGAIAALKKNGVVFWLDRDPGTTYENLDKTGRPLAQAGRADFIARYEHRVPVYRRWADHIIRSTTPEGAADAVAGIYWGL